MRGSIRAKVPGKRYEIRVALGRDPTTGRYRQKSLTVHGSKRVIEFDGTMLFFPDERADSFTRELRRFWQQWSDDES